MTMEHERRCASRGRNQAFTLIELLMVILIISVLVGLLMPAFYMTRKNAMARQTEMDRKTIAFALLNYRREYAQWPNPDDGQSVYTTNNHVVVEMLLGKDADQPFKYINVSGYNRDQQGSLQRPDGQYYSLDFSDSMAKVDGVAVDSYE